MNDPKCYTCSLIGSAVTGEHAHTFDEMTRAELAERDVRPYRAKALFAMVAASRATPIKAT